VVVRLWRRSVAVVACIMLVWLAGPEVAHAATRVHALIVGNNRAFPRDAAGADASLAPLHYADDDAAAFYELIMPMASSAELLTVMDVETQADYPSLASRAEVPTLARVREAVASLRARITAQHESGHRNVVFVFFSGHGSVSYDGRPALALFDGGLSQDFLYREILEQLPADEVHLLIDACHAEAVVRPRDLEAEAATISPDQANAFLVETTLARFPHVGAIVAATTDSKAHEWDALRHGIFTYELISALRGAADVNRDRRIEYSEVYAFMAAANREVGDVRARLAVVARPPGANRRAALATLSEFPQERLAWLSGVPGRYGIIELSDERGRRLATLHGDREFVADLLVPAFSTVYVRSGDREASFRASAGEILPFERLQMTGRTARERGALDEAMRRGLFAAAYGRSYYDGVVDQVPSFIRVDFPDTDDQGPADYWRTQHTGPLANHKVVLGGGISVGVADLVPLTHGLSLGLRPALGSGATASLRVMRASDGPLTEWHVDANVGWLWSIAYRQLRGWGGAAVGAGVLAQAVEAGSSRYSPAASAGPVFGFSVDVDSHFGLWSELEVTGLLHRRDDRSMVSLVPSAWLGAALRL
jgi:hypothetical protein